MLQMKLSFHLIVEHGYVHGGFGNGIIIPLVKDKNEKSQFSGEL